MTRRYWLYGGVIAVLVAVNLGRWWLHGGAGSGTSASPSPAFLANDFRLRANVPATGEARRNLFAPLATDLAVVRPARTMRAPQAAPPPAVLSDVPSAAAASLGRLRLLGVVFRGGKAQAYLALDKQSVIAHSGDTVFGQFTVDTVTVDAVELRHLESNILRRIPVSGK